MYYCRNFINQVVFFLINELKKLNALQNQWYFLVYLCLSSDYLPKITNNFLNAVLLIVLYGKHHNMQSCIILTANYIFKSLIIILNYGEVNRWWRQICTVHKWKIVIFIIFKARMRTVLKRKFVLWLIFNFNYVSG